MNDDSEFEIRPLTREEMSLPIEWAAREGWNPGWHDAECFHAADPDGFLVGELDGAPIGCISAVSYGGEFGFIGLYIVRPEFRGRGFGMRLWRAAMDRLAGMNVGLDGVVAQQANYAKSGFRLAYRNIRYGGTAARFANHGRSAARVLAAADVPLADLVAYDRAIFPASRESFLEVWISQPQTGAFAAVDDGGRLLGYAAVRPAREGWKIGPLAANDLATARQLYAAAAAHAGEGSMLYLDVPEPNDDARRLAEELPMSPVFETARMYTGAAPAIDLGKVFGVTTFELG
jgi:GNAT superfamily N-acetyltransferase